MDPGKQLATKLGFLQRVRNAVHPPEQFPHRIRLGGNLRKNAFVKDIEKLRHTNERRDAMFVKGLHDPLRRHARKENHGCAETEWPQSIRNEWQDMRERQHGQNPMLIRNIQSLRATPNLMREIECSQLHSFGIARGTRGVNDKGRLVIARLFEGRRLTFEFQNLVCGEFDYFRGNASRFFEILRVAEDKPALRVAV